MDELKHTSPLEEHPSNGFKSENGGVTPSATPTPMPSTPSYTGQPRPSVQAPYYGYSQPSPRPSFYPPYGAPNSLIPPREPAQSRFSEHPGGNWTHPIEQTPQSTPAPTTYAKARTNGSSKLIALLLCLCILLSGASGFVGMLIGRSLSPANTATGGTTVMWETGPSTPMPNGTTSDDALIAAAASARKSVVEITTETIVSGSFFGESVQSGAGSGVIVTNDGYIVTNHHVIDGANTITVRLENGESYAAILRGSDAETDLAVIKINVTAPLTPAQWGRSEDLRVGQHVLAIGNPLGTLGGSVSDGIISALDREITVGGIPMTLLQTNAAVNPGNSGGGLFNLAGQLIGIVNAKYTDESLEGLGFAIPQKIATMITEDLIAKGYVSGRPQIGLQLVNITSTNINQALSEYPALSNYVNGLRSYGVYISEVTGADIVSGSLLLGDLLDTIDGKKIASFNDIQTALRAHRVGDEITITVKRLNVATPVTATVRLTQKTTSTSLN